MPLLVALLFSTIAARSLTDKKSGMIDRETA